MAGQKWSDTRPCVRGMWLRNAQHALDPAKNSPKVELCVLCGQERDTPGENTDPCWMMAGTDAPESAPDDGRAT